MNRHPHASTPDVLFYVGSKDNPARQINLRAIDPERYSIVNEAAGGEVLEEIEESKAFFEVYDGAVYLYQARPQALTIMHGGGGALHDVQMMHLPAGPIF